MPEETQVEIKAAKGRPMLTWVGKHPLQRVTAYPAQHVEHFAAVASPAQTAPNLLCHGDNKDVLAYLLANGYRGRVNLIYIDPPFDSGADYVRKVSLRGTGSGGAKLDGEGYTLGEQIQYTDIWTNDNYLQFMYERLQLLKELLAEDGSIYLHCDWHKSHHLRCLMDEVFGVDNFRNEIVWQRLSARSDSQTYNHIHDMLLFYSKSDSLHWTKVYTEYSSEYIEKFYRFTDDQGRRYSLGDLMAPGTRNGKTGEAWNGINPTVQGKHWVVGVDKLGEYEKQRKIEWPEGGRIPRLRRYLDEMPGIAPQTLWDDISLVQAVSLENQFYPTQKPEALVARILLASSYPGDLVLDCFIGSGTTAAVAQKLGRRWIGCDINKGAIQTTSRRLQSIIGEQAVALAQAQANNGLFVAEEHAEHVAAHTFDATCPLCLSRVALAFDVYRVNDYDLQIQHNEAVNLACEHLGVTRTRGDVFFDGTLGKRLVKITPFNHPLSPLDLEELKRELAARPEEDRDVVIVCLGRELATEAWLEDWNRLRQRGDVPNKIEVVELRSDPKYGGFFAHEAAQARVDIRREHDRLCVEIVDVISPTIVQRLRQQDGLLAPHIDDWRAVVDAVMIDTSYDGNVFDITWADVPEKKTDLVAGRYELAAPAGETTVAVKIIDMLGEEILVTGTA